MWPWGRIGTVRKDLLAATKSEAEGGNGMDARDEMWTKANCA